MYVKPVDYIIATALVAALFAGPAVLNFVAFDVAGGEENHEEVRELDPETVNLLSDAYDFAGDDLRSEEQSSPEDHIVPEQETEEAVALKSAPQVMDEQAARDSEPNTMETTQAVVIAAADRNESLNDVLNDHEVETLEELVAEGQSLIAEGADCPPYTADLPQDQLNRIVERGMARLVVTAGIDHLFVFPGTLRAPGRARLACRKDMAGFSARALFIDGARARELVRSVGSEFNLSQHKLAAAVVLQADLDAAVLASQRRAAVNVGVPLEDVRLTDGAFRTANGLPWRYCVNSICLGDGRCIEPMARRPNSTVAEGGGD